VQPLHVPHGVEGGGSIVGGGAGSARRRHPRIIGPTAKNTLSGVGPRRRGQQTSRRDVFGRAPPVRLPALEMLAKRVELGSGNTPRAMVW
jgi:hypothetical protein